jgi:hypothetical protein
MNNSNFIALLDGLMLFGENYPVDISLKWKNFYRLSATGVSIFNYESGRWSVGMILHIDLSNKVDQTHKKDWG